MSAGAGRERSIFQRPRASGGAARAWEHGSAAARPRLGDLAQRLLLETYAPASVLINRSNECLYYLGATDRYLRVVRASPAAT